MAKKSGYKKKKWHGFDLYTCAYCKFDVLHERAAMVAHVYRFHNDVGEVNEQAIVPVEDKKDGE